MNKQWLLASGLVLSVLVGSPACGGEEFCEESRTCDGDPVGASGAAGAEGKPAGAGATGVEPGEGGQAGGAMMASGGEGGQEPSPIGMPCTDDLECDDGDSCTGTEACVSGVCEAGQAVECGPGMECSAEQDNACVFSSAAPWIIFTSDDETTGVLEAFGVKADLVGQMDPIKVSPALDAGWRASHVPAWSPDGSAFVLITSNQANTQTKAYLIRLGDGLPAVPVELTDGMSASKITVVSWSPGGGLLAITRDDGLHAIDISDVGSVTHARVSTDSYDQINGWAKSDAELVYTARNIATTKSAITLAVRNGNAWTLHPLVSGLTMLGSVASRDRSVIAYSVDNGSNLRTLWTLEAVMGSRPVHIVGPARDLAFYPSPDLSKYLMATTADVQANSDVFGGVISTLSAPPSVKADVLLFASDILGATFEGPWSPDSSRAAIFQKGTLSQFARQLVMYQPGAAEPWQVYPEQQASRNDGEPVWSPSSELMALPTRTAAASSVTLTLVASPTSKLDLDTVPSAGRFRVEGFSAAGEYMAYYKSSDGVTQDGAYVDLRQGLANAGPAVPLPGVGSISGIDLATTTLDLVYVRGSKCHYLDLSGDDAAAPAPVNRNGSVNRCIFQRLPQ